MTARDVGPTEDSTDYEWTPAWLGQARRRPHRRRALLVAAGLVGLGLAWVHWFGLVLGGALVGLPSRTVPRAIAAGLVFGVAALALTVLWAPSVDITAFLGLTPISHLTIAAAVIGPVWGALVRLLV